MSEFSPLPQQTPGPAVHQDTRPAYPAFPPGPYPPPGPRRRWPAIAAGTAAGAIIAATVATAIATHTTTRANSADHAPVTVTVTETPAPPAPLPTAQADRQTCNAWLSAGKKIRLAQDTLPTLPQGMTLLDPAVRQNVEWSAAFRKAADLYDQAADELAAGIAPGSTAILTQSAHSAVNAFHALSIANATFDAAEGNTYHLAHESSDTVDVLCERLAP